MSDRWAGKPSVHKQIQGHGWNQMTNTWEKAPERAPGRRIQKPPGIDLMEWILRAGAGVEGMISPDFRNDPEVVKYLYDNPDASLIEAAQKYPEIWSRYSDEPIPDAGRMPKPETGSKMDKILGDVKKSRSSPLLRNAPEKTKKKQPYVNTTGNPLLD